MTTRNDSDVPSLGAGGGDRTAAVIRSVISNIPFVGAALAEIITELVPNQRIERVEKYLVYLGEEIAARRIDETAMKTPANIDLIEDGAYQAVRALTDERKRFLARAVAQGIQAEEKDKLNEKRVLALIRDLDDGDLLLLNAFASNAEEKPKKFANLRPEPAMVGSPSEVREAEELYKASIGRLERLSLIRKHVQIDYDSKLPEFDEFTGEPRGFHLATSLGLLVLGRIGLDT